MESAVKKFPSDMSGKLKELLGIQKFLLARGGRLYWKCTGKRREGVGKEDLGQKGTQRQIMKAISAKMQQEYKWEKINKPWAAKR